MATEFNPRGRDDEQQADGNGGGTPANEAKERSAKTTQGHHAIETGLGACGSGLAATSTSDAELRNLSVASPGRD